eukprot:NODE_43_length_33755_cov_1.178542.p28 type:complete len:175 gc:universal NODE_43_length_33755_cov_1.178542:25751-26275(+)
MFYRIWAISLVLLAIVILWPSPESIKTRKSPTAPVNDKIRWLILHVDQNLLLDKFNRTLGSLNYKDNTLYFNPYTYNLCYNLDSVSLPSECIIHTNYENSTELLTQCLIATMRGDIERKGEAFKRWYGASVHFSYDGVLDMLDILDNFAWVSTDFDAQGNLYLFRLFGLFSNSL